MNRWKDSPELCAALSRLINDPTFQRAKEDALAKASPPGTMDWASVLAAPDDKLKQMGIEHAWLTGFVAAFRALEDMALMAQREERGAEKLPPPFSYIQDEIED